MSSDRQERFVITITVVAAVIAFWFFTCAALRADETVVLCFSGPACPFCAQQKPAWQAFKRANPGVKVVDVDTDQEPAATRRWGVKTIPTTIIVSADAAGQSIERQRLVGLTTAGKITAGLK